MYLASVDGFDGDGDVLAKFGLTITDTAEFVVSKRRFEEVVTTEQRPTEGDLLYFPLSNSIFEITYVQHENPFYQLGKRHSYKLTCELYTHSYDEINTGISNIDSINDIDNNAAEVDEADNDEIETLSDALIDFSAQNPFGEI